MRSIPLSLGLAVAAMALMFAGPAHSQATRTWVSGVGDDVNPCSRTAPCKTFAGAISKTAMNGEINCLDPGGFGAVTITKSITIDCHAEFGSILNSGTNGINIPFDSFNAADVRKTVRLRNIMINGANTGLTGIRVTGGATIAAGVVFVENCLIDGNFGGTGHGINDERVAGGELHIANTVVSNNGAVGVRIQPGNGTSAGQRLDATLDNVRVQNANTGAAFNSNARVMVNRSVISGNTGSGIVGNSAFGAPVVVHVSNSVISGNGTGIASAAAVVTIRLGNNDIAHNTTAITGATLSYGNNRIDGNGAAGTAPTAISQR